MTFLGYWTYSESPYFCIRRRCLSLLSPKQGLANVALSRMASHLWYPRLSK